MITQNLQASAGEASQRRGIYEDPALKKIPRTRTNCHRRNPLLKIHLSDSSLSKYCKLTSKVDIGAPFEAIRHKYL